MPLTELRQCEPSMADTRAVVDAGRTSDCLVAPGDCRAIFKILQGENQFPSRRLFRPVDLRDRSMSNREHSVTIRVGVTL